MSGAHAIRHPWRKWVIICVVLALAAVPWFLGGDRAGAVTTGGVRAAATAVFPQQDACHATNNAAPKGDCGAFKQVYRETFNGLNAPVGSWSDCGGDYDYKCEGLRTKYPRYYSGLGAYPSGWPDTAASGADGNSGPVPGYYRPELTMSVYSYTQTDGFKDGRMRVHMYRPSSGDSNRVAAPVPLASVNLRYGKFTERFKVSARTPGFKMAHLHYSPDEIDYPEAGQTFQYDPISLFTHGFDNYGKDVAPNSAWTGWHTYSTEITPGKVRVFYDGVLVATRNSDYPDATPWVLQNESALGPVPGAVAGSSVNIDTTWLTVYKYAP